MTLNNKISLCLINVSLSEFLESKKISKSQAKKWGVKAKTLEKTGTVEVPLNLLNNLLINPKFCGEEPSIIFEDEHLIVLHKPIGIHNHPLSYLESDNCLSYLRETDSKNRALFTDVERYDRGLLYRLDYLTSGLLIFSKRDGEADLYRQKQGNKFYLAICEGKIKDNFSLENFITYHGPKKSHAQVHLVGEEKEKANLIGTRVDYNDEQDLSLCLINLNQGKRHQIRAQLSNFGFPILGDTQYGGGKSPRMYLHAYHYEFTHFNNEYSLFDENLDLFERVFDLHRVSEMLHQSVIRLKGSHSGK